MVKGCRIANPSFLSSFSETVGTVLVFELSKRRTYDVRDEDERLEKPCRGEYLCETEWWEVFIIVAGCRGSWRTACSGRSKYTKYLRTARKTRL